MRQFKDLMVANIVRAALELASELNLSVNISADNFLIEVPPRPELGDFSFPMFPLATLFKMSPQRIAQGILPFLIAQGLHAEVVGPYINIRLNRAQSILDIMLCIQEEGDDYGFSSILSDRRIVVEFSSPNTNKPLHLGHLRNNALGESLSRIFLASGAEVRKVNLINDRGIHVCKTMLAYKELGEGKTPETSGIKSDHFVGTYYVAFRDLMAEDAEAERRAQDLLYLWEAGDDETIALWKTMRDWALEGLHASYERTGIHFDAVYFESDSYILGKTYVQDGLDRGLFFKDDSGTIWIDLNDIGLDRKVLLRRDGTSLYITQDIGTALQRYKDWPFDAMYYVVANEQNYHFKVLFHVLFKLGLTWASDLDHISYGMVNLPEGKMKSREGIVVDADTLLNELHDMGLTQIKQKDRNLTVEDSDNIAEAVALGALHYYLLHVSPSKNMIFNPQESISLNGNTGPYLQYMGARISSMFRKYGDTLPKVEEISWDLLNEDIEWMIIKLISSFPEIVEAAGCRRDPSLIASYLYDLAKAFTRFYHDIPVLNCQHSELRNARLSLVRAVHIVLKCGLWLINVPFLEQM